MMQRALREIEQRLGGRARFTVIGTLAAVLALDSADKGTIGATATNLQHELSIGTTGIGLLVTVSSLVGTVFTVPFGALADRVDRIRILFWVIGLWGVAMLAGAAAPSYGWLLASRVFLGGVTAAAAPVVASLVGDWFPARERGHVLGLILTGELVGTGFGIAVAGSTAAISSWRVSFALLALPAAAVAWLVRRLPEPARGTTRPLLAGQRELVRAPARPGGEEAARSADQGGAGGVAAGPTGPEGSAGAGAGAGARDGDAGAGDAGDGDVMRSLVAESGTEPDPAAVVQGDLRRRSIWTVLLYIVRVRTNVYLIVASALGYYMFAGVRAFGVEFADKHYGVGQAAASALVFVLGAGAVVGVVVGGRLSDRLIARGRLDARILVPIVAYVAMVVVLVPALVVTAIAVALPLLSLAGFFLAASNPPLDAARLDVIPSQMWGRAEAVRSLLRTALEALAPLVFGALAQHAFGGGGRALEATFLVMLVPLMASPIVLGFARRTYLTDIATAEATAEAQRAFSRSGSGDGGDRTT